MFKVIKSFNCRVSGKHYPVGKTYKGTKERTDYLVARGYIEKVEEESDNGKKN